MRLVREANRIRAMTVFVVKEGPEAWAGEGHSCRP